MLGKAIASVQDLEKQITGKTPGQLHARVAIRACLKELRSIATDGPEADQERRELDGTVLQFISRAPSLIPNP